MSKTLQAILVLLLAGGGGYLVYYLTDSNTAGYIVSVVGTAAGLTSIFISLRGKGASTEGPQRPAIESKVKIGRAENAKITGVDYSGKTHTKSDVQIDEIKGGEATGVRSKENDN